MFRGASNLSLDAKGRLMIPSRYRDMIHDACEGRVVITAHGTDRCLLLYPMHEWDVFERQFKGLPGMDKRARMLERKMIGFATECEIDGNGRVLLSPALRAYAGLDRRVMLIGLINRFELWDEQSWNEQASLPSSGPDDLPATDFLSKFSL